MDPVAPARLTVPPLIASFYTLAGDTKLLIRGGTEISPFDLLRRIDVAAETGYAGVAFADRDLAHWAQTYPLPEIRAHLDAAGIEIVELEMLFHWFTEGERRDASDAMRRDLLHWANELGARHIKVGTDFYGLPAEFDRLVDEFGALCREAAEVGAKIALEPMPRATVRTPDHALRIVEAAGEPNGGVLLDIGHVVRSETPYDELRRIPADRIISVELHDGAAVPVDNDLFTDSADYRRLAGEGDYDVDAFLDAIFSTGYAGPFGDENLSIANRQRTLEEAATANFGAMSRAIRRVLENRQAADARSATS